MKKITYLLLAAFISATSCNKDDGDPVPPPSTPKANVMFGNVSVDVTSATAKINGTAVSSASNMAFLASTGYIAVDPATNATLAFATSSNLTLKSTNATLNANNNYSVFLTGDITKPDVAFATDDLTNPTTGKAKVRFFHLASDTLKLTATVDTTTIATGITTKNVSNFVEVPAGTWSIVVADPTAIHQTLTLSGQQLAAGKIYTVIKTGIQGGTNNAGYKLTLLTNK